MVEPRGRVLNYWRFFPNYFFSAEGDRQLAPDISIAILMFIGGVVYESFWNLKAIFKNSGNIEYLFTICHCVAYFL